MQNYKIRIPNPEISRAVQEKAFELGHSWFRRGKMIKNGVDELYLSKSGYLGYMNNDFSGTFFDSHINAEISPEDFLQLGEIDINNCKIRLSERHLVSLNEKLKSLKIKGYGNNNPWVSLLDPVRDLWGQILTNTEYNVQRHPGFMFIRNGRTVMVGTELYFNSLKEKEITIEQIMQIQQPIIKQQEEPMEIRLQCTKSPVKAKNITVGKEYAGIYVDGDDSQVDNIKDAEYFQIVNNNGIEAKYKISLFKAGDTVVPPRPAVVKPTMAEVIETIEVNSDEVNITINKNEIKFCDCGTNNLDSGDVNCSCGIFSCQGLNELMSEIERSIDEDGNNLGDLISDYNEENLVKAIFTEVVETKISNAGAAFVLFSTRTQEDLVCSLMDAITQKLGGSISESRINPNSRNTIKAWLIHA